MSLKRTVDLTKVNLEWKSILFMTVAFGAVILAWGGGNWLAKKVQGLTQKGGATDPFA